MFLCELLTCRALASVSPGLAMAARMAVVVVPIFEPRDNGYALSMLMTPIPIQKKLVKYTFSDTCTQTHTPTFSLASFLCPSCFTRKSVTFISFKSELLWVKQQQNNASEVRVSP